MRRTADEKDPRNERVAVRITLIYLTVGALWIILSDTIALTLAPDPYYLSMIQTYKGWLYVLATTVMLYALIRHDMRRLQRSEDVRREQEKLFRRRYEAIAAGIIVQDTDDVVIYANKAASDILGLPAEAIIGQQCFPEHWQLIGEDGIPIGCDQCPAAVAARTGRPVKGVLLGFTAGDSRERKWLLMSAEPILDEQGEPIEAVATFLDVTDRRLIEEELARSREAEMRIHAEAEKAKRDFYRGTIFSVTEGKLNLVGPEQIRSVLGSPDMQLTLRSREGLSELRDLVSRVCKETGMPGDREFMFVSAVGEAAANAIKHAGGGIASVTTSDGEVRVCIQDKGPGMDTLVLPRATLMRRFSTVSSMGLGYSMILESVDRVYLSTGPEGTSVLLEIAAEAPRHEMNLDALPDTW